MDEKNILNSNLIKWKTLPAGQRRESVDKLLSYEPEELVSFYQNCMVFWEKERGWEYDKYATLFSSLSVLEIGSGLGYDGVTFAGSAKKWTFCDIIPQNLEFIKRITNSINITNVSFQLNEDIVHHDYREMFDGFYAHGVLHHVPFDIAKQEVANIDRFLKPGTKVVVLMYPYERWVQCGKPPFEEFGCMTDGEDTPWAEYYDGKKIMALFGDEYILENSIKWGHQDAEFINFELTKRVKPVA